MKIIGVYDNGGETFDRYTIVLDSFQNETLEKFKMYECLGLSSNPGDPQGFSQWTTCQMGRHLGKKLKFEELPENVQKHVLGRIEG